MLQDVHIVNPPCSSQSLGRFLFKHRSVELPATSLSEGPEKTFDDRYGNSSPRHMRENHYAVLVIFENFLRFSLARVQHNASFFSYLCIGKSHCSIPIAKLAKKNNRLHKLLLYI